MLVRFEANFNVAFWVREVFPVRVWMDGGGILCTARLWSFPPFLRELGGRSCWKGCGLRALSPGRLFVLDPLPLR